MTALLTLLALLAGTPDGGAPMRATDAGGSQLPVVSFEEVEGGGITTERLHAPDGGAMTAPRVDLDAGWPDFEWTREQLRAGVGGKAVLRCVLSAQGVPSGCKVLQGVPGVESLQLRRFMEALRFTPATMEGQPVDVERLVWTIRLVGQDDPDFRARLVAVASRPKLIAADSKPWSWTKEQLAAPKPLRLAASCRVTARGRLTDCAQSERPPVVSEEQLGDFLDGLRYEPARDKEGNPLNMLNFRVPVVLYNP